MAEQNLVDGLQNLRVVAAYDLAVMDDLARDFANALEDFPMTTRLKNGANEQIRRRRFKKRRPKGTLHFCSDSDSDQERMVTNDSSNKKFSDSDSDDVEFFTKQRYSLSMFPAISAPLLVESDSVTDCLPPNHPPRRRKLLKKMIVEDIKLKVGNSLAGDGIDSAKGTKGKTNSTNGGSSSSSSNNNNIIIISPDVIPVRKRKRSIRENRATFLEACDNIGGRLLSPCSCKSDVENSTGEERDADDEQSDFYLEPDQCCHGPPYKLAATRCSPPPTNTPTGGGGGGGSCRKFSLWTRETKSRRSCAKNHAVKHLLDRQQVTIALNGRLFIPARRKLIGASNCQHVDSGEGGVGSELATASNASQDMEVSCPATPLSSPPLNCHKRHKLCHEAGGVFEHRSTCLKSYLFY